MYVDPCGTCVHNGKAQGYGDCANCLAGLTEPGYDQIVVNDSLTQDDYDWEQHFINETNNSTLEPGNGFTYSDAQNVVNIPLNILAVFMGNFADDAFSAVSVSSVGYMITTPIAITMHIGNPNLTPSEKGIMSLYEVGVAAGGIGLTYGVVNCWNPSGWVVLGVTVVYSTGTYVVGSILQSYFENN